uniref:Uncharacterized protein n=1 Tax=Arundo donax TaxID=35708 RepID=A0A0A9AZD9_ARUDO
MQRYECVLVIQFTDRPSLSKTKNNQPGRRRCSLH